MARRSITDRRTGLRFHLGRSMADETKVFIDLGGNSTSVVMTGAGALSTAATLREIADTLEKEWAGKITGGPGIRRR